MVLSTGKVFEIIEPNDAGGQGSENLSMAMDADLQSIATDEVKDVAVYEIEFIPHSEHYRI